MMKIEEKTYKPMRSPEWPDQEEVLPYLTLVSLFIILKHSQKFLLCFQKILQMVASLKLGFVKDAHHHIDIQGFNVYHKNRLIKVTDNNSSRVSLDIVSTYLNFIFFSHFGGFGMLLEVMDVALLEYWKLISYNQLIISKDLSEPSFLLNSKADWSHTKRTIGIIIVYSRHYYY